MSALKLLTFNMECSVFQTRHEKINILVSFIKLKNINCVLLQDVNTTTLSLFKSKLSNFNVIESLDSENNINSQIMFVLKEIKIVEEYSYDIPSNESHEVICCKVIFGEKEIELINIHLENENENYRKKQIETLFEISKENKNNIIVGEFNICNEECNLLLLNNSQFVDPWIEDGCNIQLRNTTLYKEKWYRTQRLMYQNSQLECHCVGLLNFNSNKSCLIYDIN
jgi:endonuclease/exonuclease/phosphatase family metal-dependent hydrolase